MADGCAVATMVVGLAVLAGWALDVQALKSILPGLATMKPNTALCFTLAGAALRFRGRPTVRRVCAGAVLAISGLTLVQEVTGANLGIDELIFRDVPAADPKVAPGRMSAATGVAFLLSATALLCLPLRGVTAQILALATGSLGFVALLGYAYGVEQLYHLPGFASVALHTATAFVVLSAGILCACPAGIASVFASPDLGGQLARRLLPLAVLIPAVLGWVQLLGERSGMYGAAQGTALLASAMILALAAVMWRTARSLQGSEAERMRAEAALREAYGLLHAVAESVPDAIFVKDVKGRYLMINAAGAQVFGRPVEDVLGKNLGDLLLPEEARKVIADDREVMVEGGSRTCEESIAVGGVARTFLSTKAPYRNAEGEIVGVLGIRRDITERKRIEAALREHEQQLRLFAEHAPAAIAMLDTEMRYVAASRRWLTDFGFEGQDLSGRSHYEVFPEIPERSKEIYRRCLAGAVERAEEEPFVRSDGRTQWIRWEVRPWYAASGAIGGVVIFSEDITPRKEAELALRESEQRLAGIVNSAMDAIVSVDGDLRVLLFNSAAEKMFGYTAQEALGMPLSRLIPERLRAAHEQHVRDFATTGITARRMGSLHEISGRHSNGEEFPIEASISQVEVGGRKVLTVIHRDITERKRDEDALRESAAELRAVSAKLAEAQEAERQAIARELHDQIGQSLTALSLNLRILRDQLSEASAKKIGRRVEDSLELVAATAEQVRSLMVELQPPLLDDYGLAAALRWYAGQFSERWGIAATAHGQEPEPRLGREKEIAMFRVAQEALNNVVKHAAADQVEITLEPTTGGARLTIADDGRGFDPTVGRAAHRPPAWGLRTMAGRAAAVGGRLRVESTPGKGTRVVVEISEDGS